MQLFNSGFCFFNLFVCFGSEYIENKGRKNHDKTHRRSVQHPRNCTHFFFSFFFLMCINISAKRMEKGVWCANNKQECMQRPNLLCRVPLFLGGVVVDGVRASARPALGAAQVLFMGCLCPILSSCSLPTLSLTGMQGSLLRNALTVLLAVLLPSPGCFLGEFLLYLTWCQGLQV